MRTCRLSGARVYGPDLGTAVRSSAHNNAAEMATEKRLASALGAGDWPWQTGVVHRLVLGRGSIFADPLALRILAEDAGTVARRAEEHPTRRGLRSYLFRAADVGRGSGGRKLLIQRCKLFYLARMRALRRSRMVNPPIHR